MPNVPVAKDVVLTDPDDFQYVSIKNWLRKKKVLTGNDKLANFVGRPGPITGFVIGIIAVGILAFAFRC